MIRKDNFVEGEYYHIYNRGVEKRNIFLDNNDYWRFLTLLLAFQGKAYIPQISRIITYVKNQEFNNELFKEILANRTTELVCFCLMPNHFHFILKEIKKNGISNFMQRLCNGYAKYFNTKNGRAGHLFGGPFKSIHIDKNEYLNHLSVYIHLNPRELLKWRGKEIKFPWSSFQDYAQTNRWGSFLNSDIIIDQFRNTKEYQSFVRESITKTNLEFDYLID